MRKIFLFILPLFAASTPSFGQHSSNGRVSSIQEEIKYPQFPDWDPNPKMHPIPPEYANEHALILLQSEKRDYKFEGSGITMYSTIHQIVKVLDRYGIEEYNSKYIPFRSGQNRVDSIKARTILPDGTVHNIKYEMIYGGSNGFLFNLDGMEKNAEVEIVIKYKAISSYFGSIRFQSENPILNAFLELNYPKELTFNIKGYHGFPSGEVKTVGGHQQVKIYQADIPALHEQPYSYYDLYCMRFEYGLDHYTHRGGYERDDNFTWDMLAHNVYKEYYNFKGNEKTAVTKFLTTIGIRGGEKETDKIKMIEEGIKANITAYWEISGKGGETVDTTPEGRFKEYHLGYGQQEAENLDSIIQKKSASDKGIIKLFCACLKEAGVKHELGVTSNRKEHLMDSKFINWEPLNHYLFYFPKTDGFLAPIQPFYRYPEIPSEYINNKGVFCKTNPESEFNIGKEVTEAEAIIRSITPLPASYTQVNTNATINLDKDMTTVVDIKRSFSGYSAPEHRARLAVATPDEKRKMVINESLLADKLEMIKKYSFENESISAVYEHKPLIINVTVATSELVEKAGANYLLKIGNVIGTQFDFYSKEERILPIDINYPYVNTFKISVTLPDGFKPVNLEGLKIHEEHNDKNTGNSTASFTSDYQLKGNTLTVTVYETYPQLHYSVNEFESFKKVINAAADFSKAAIILQPEKTKAVKKSKPRVVAANRK